MTLLGLAAGALVACSNSDNGQTPSAGGESSYEWFTGTTAMFESADLVVEAVGLPIKTEHIFALPAHRVTVSPDGSQHADSLDVAVYEVVVSEVRKGRITVRAGESILVVPAVDGDTSPPTSQAGMLETTADATLYLTLADKVPSSSEADVWKTLSPYQGIAP